MKVVYKILLILFVLTNTASASLWVIKDAGLQDANNFVDIGRGSPGSTLNNRINLPGNPAERFNITLNGPDWQDIMIGDSYDLPSEGAGVAMDTGNGGNLSDYNYFSMTVHNPNNKTFMAALFIETGYDDLGEPVLAYRNGDGSLTAIAPGQTVKMTLDFNDAALWNGSSWIGRQAVQRINHIINIGLKVGGNCSNPSDVQSGVPFDVDVIGNVLILNVPPASLYVKPGENVVFDMDVASLIQKVNGCQAMLGYNSIFFPNPTGAVVTPGGGVWDLVIYDSWDVGSGIAGEIDTAIGVDAYGAVGTDADGIVAKITLKAGSTQGATQLVFRPDEVSDEALIKSTIFSDMFANPVWPAKLDSRTVIIDGNIPSIDITSANQNSTELLGTFVSAVQGTVNIQVAAGDGLSGLSGQPVVTVTAQGGLPENAVFVNELPVGTFNYTWDINSSASNGTAVINAQINDNSGNLAEDSDTFNINKNQITGTVSMATLSGVSYSFNRLVVFKASDIAGNILKSWIVTVSFVNSSGTASGSYTLTDVPAGISNLSAKTDWSLRKRQAVVLDGNGQASINFVLLGGDLDNGNSVNILDYSVLKVNWMTTNPVADINGDGRVQLFDYSIMKSNWFKLGEPE